jgi:hypothetical protein
MDQEFTNTVDILFKFFPPDLVMLSVAQGIIIGFILSGVGVVFEFMFAPHGSYSHAVRAAQTAGAEADKLEILGAQLEGKVSAARLQLQALLGAGDARGPPEVMADPLRPPSTI